jgi:hypothetical protein
MVLLEIGLWAPLRNIFPSPYGIPEDTSDVDKQLAARCGTKYLQAVKACWRAVDEELSTVSRPEVTLQKVYGRVVSALEACCVIDDAIEQDDVLEVCSRISPVLQIQELCTKVSEATSLNVTARWPKLSEQQRGMDVLSNVIKARDVHYSKKATSPPATQRPVISSVQQRASAPVVLQTSASTNEEYPPEKVQYTENAAAMESKHFEKASDKKH